MVRSWRTVITRLVVVDSTTTPRWRDSLRTNSKSSVARGRSWQELDAGSLKRALRKCYFQRAGIDVRPLLS